MHFLSNITVCFKRVWQRNRAIEYGHTRDGILLSRWVHSLRVALATQINFEFQLHFKESDKRSWSLGGRWWLQTASSGLISVSPTIQILGTNFGVERFWMLEFEWNGRTLRPKSPSLGNLEQTKQSDTFDVKASFSSFSWSNSRGKTRKFTTPSRTSPPNYE